MELLQTIIFYAGWVFIFIGGLFVLLSAIGLIRMPDTFTRLHAGTKSSTLGIAMSTIGVGMVNTEWFLKLFILAIFFLITNPISSSVLARATYKNNGKFINKSKIDMYKEVSLSQDDEIALSQNEVSISQDENRRACVEDDKTEESK